MTVTINLEPEKEALLRERVEQQGQDLDSYIQNLVERDVSMAAEVPLNIALADLLAKAEALEPVTPRPGMKDAFGEIIAEKYRRQGFDV